MVRPGYLCVLFLGVIIFHLSCYSEIEEKKKDYWAEYDSECLTIAKPYNNTCNVCQNWSQIDQLFCHLENLVS